MRDGWGVLDNNVAQLPVIHDFNLVLLNHLQLLKRVRMLRIHDVTNIIWRDGEGAKVSVSLLWGKKEGRGLTVDLGCRDHLSDGARGGRG